MKIKQIDNYLIWYKICTKLVDLARLYKLFDTFAARVSD